MTYTRKTAPSTKNSDAGETLKKLSAENLKLALWETLHAIKSDTMLPAQGDAIASQAREILRTVKIQTQVAAQGKRSIPNDVIDFTENRQ